MKRIVAFVKPNMLDDVINALHEVGGFPGASIEWPCSIHDHCARLGVGDA